MNAKARDLLGSVFMLVFVVSLWMQRDFNTPFGAIFPDIWLGILAGLVATTVVLTFTPWPALRDEVNEEQKTRVHWFDMALVGGILLVWALLLRYLGFILTGVCGFGIISWFLNNRRNTLRGVFESGVVGVGMVVLLVLVFEYLLKVPLPKGNLFG